MKKIIKNFLRMLSFLKILASPSKWGLIVRTYENSKFDAEFNISWSQSGEDLALQRIFESINRGFYIDIGAHDPSRFSVTRKLYQQGWNGINIDANNECINQFLKHRHRDITLNFAVGEKSEYKFYDFFEPAISTTNDSWRDYLKENGRKIKSESIVTGITLKKILAMVPKGVNIDLLNLDIEGSELDALRSGNLENINSKQLPTYILLETPPPVHSALEMPASKYLIKLGYIPWLVLAQNTLFKIE